MSQEKLQTMSMQNFGGVKEVHYGIVQVVNRNSIAHSRLRSKSSRYYPSRVILRNSPLLKVSIVCLAAVTTQITAAKKARLVIHSSNCKWPLGITVLARLRDVTSMAKPEKP